MRFALILLMLAPFVAELRTWTDSTGKHKTQAELLESHGGVAYLRINGKAKPVPVAKLSANDQRFIHTSDSVQVLVGRVVGITDGDSLTLLDANKQQYKIRLEGIDAPESKQAFGTKSRQSLATKIFQKDVIVEWKKKDRYGRTLGHVLVDGKWINQEQIAEGWAWHYKKFSKSLVLADAELSARAAKLGLWAESGPTPPWEFRNPPDAPRPPPPAAITAITSAITSTPKAAAPIVTVYVADTGEKYHRESCRFVKKSKSAMTLSDAVRSGYEPCKVCHPPTQ